MMNTQEKMKKDAWSLLNGIVKAQKLMRKNFKDLDVKVLLSNNHIQVTNLAHWCELLEIPYIRENWEGNTFCESDWDVIYFEYKGYRFLELIEKEEVL